MLIVSILWITDLKRLRVVSGSPECRLTRPDWTKNCCSFLLLPTVASKKYTEYYGRFLRCCGFLWLVSAFCSFLDRRPPQNLSVVQLVRLVRVVNGCKWNKELTCKLMISIQIHPLNKPSSCVYQSLDGSHIVKHRETDSKNPVPRPPDRSHNRSTSWAMTCTTTARVRGLESLDFINYRNLENI